jgi:hypothetical protein
MEIDLAYLKALIEDCHDPVAVVRTSNLIGERDSEEAARNTLLRHFSEPSIYKPTAHRPHVTAMRALGIDLPDDGTVRVVSFYRPTR